MATKNSLRPEKLTSLRKEADASAQLFFVRLGTSSSRGTLKAGLPRGGEAAFRGCGTRTRT
ncbi:MAG: hypothetical protein HYX22_03430 [Candidatus Yanofskybacteria bacterium]|nr:hypothetical protein [Candidatus Yanofskybacteria bacterium]